MQIFLLLIILFVSFQITLAQKVLGFDGTDTYVSVSAFNSGTTNTFTVDIWVKTIATSGYIVGNSDGNDLRINSNGTASITFFSGGGSGTITTTIAINDYVWRHLVFVRDTTNLYVYINGVLNNSSTMVSTGYSYGMQAIGRRGNAANYYKGLIHHLKLWTKALSAGEVLAEYNSGIAVACTPTTSLLACYNLTEGTGTTITDGSGNSHNGTITDASSSVDLKWFDITPSGLPKTWYVTTGGNVGNTGADSAHGWPIVYGLSHPPPFEPGDTLIINDGIYQGQFFSYITGRSNLRSTIRQPILNTWPITAKLDGLGAAGVGTGSATLSAIGPYTDYVELKVFNSNPNRISSTGLSAPTDIVVTEGIKIIGAEIKLINCYTTNNSSNGVSAFDVQNPYMSGLITSNNGWTGTDRTHAHGIYIHNGNPSWTDIVNAIASINPYYYLIQYYNSQYESPSYNLSLIGGIGINGIEGIVGSGPKHNFVINQQRVYNGGIQLGYSDEDNYELIAQDNDVFGVLQILAWRTVDVQRNRIIQDVCVTCRIADAKEYTSGLLATGTRNNNTYWGNRTGTSTNFYRYTLAGAITSSGDFNFWKTNTGYDSNSTYTSSGFPTGTWISHDQIVESPGRNHISIFNHDNNLTADINLTNYGLINGQAGTLYDLQNPEVVWSTLTYNSSSPIVTVTLPDTGSPVAQPINDASKNTHTSRKFAAFLLIPGAQTIPSTPTAPTNLIVSWNATTTKLDISFLDNASDETGFKVETSTDGTNWTLNTTLGSGSGTITATITTLTSFTRNYIRVRATNAAGDSINAGPVSEITTRVGCFLQNQLNCTR